MHFERLENPTGLTHEKKKNPQTFCVWGLCACNIQHVSTDCCCQKWRNVVRAWFREQAMIHVFFTHFSTAVIKLISLYLSPETKFCKCYLMLLAGTAWAVQWPRCKKHRTSSCSCFFFRTAAEVEWCLVQKGWWDFLVHFPPQRENNSASSSLVFLLSL